MTGGESRGEGFRGGDADLGPRVRVEHARRFSGERGADHVGDADDGRPAVTRGLDGAERVGGLARLGQRHHERLGPEHGVPVAELRAQVDLG